MVLLRRPLVLLALNLALSAALDIGDVSLHLRKHGWPEDASHTQRRLQEIQTDVGSRKLQLHDAGFDEEGDSSKDPIPGCFIVNMKEGPQQLNQDGETVGIDISRSSDLISELQAKNDDVTATSATASNFQQYTSTLDGFAACLSPELLEVCVDHADVDFVEQDITMKTSINQQNPTWGLDRIDSAQGRDNLYATGNVDGAGVDVYVIDTGVNTAHTDYSSRLKGGQNFASGGSGSRPYEDCNGHGTHCAGTVLGSTYGVAKKASLWGVRVLGCSGSGSNSAIIRGIDWSVRNAQQQGVPSVLSMSLGGGRSSSSNSAVAGAKRAGLTVVVAAGNENTDACTKSPASEKSVVTVGSTTTSDTRSSFSNYGSCVDIFAPGSSITSAWIGGSTKTNTISGTSMATPHVAGAAALELDMMKREGAGDNPDTVWSRMKSRATRSVVRGANGSPNVLLRTPEDDTPPAPTPAPTPLTGCGTDSGKIVGQRCVFPFVNKGERYTECTTDDDPDGKAWCSTQTDAQDNHVKGNWGHCNAACLNPEAPTPRPPPVPTPSPGGNGCRTKDGANVGQPCAFPFTFEGVAYNSCTAVKDPNQQLWCSTKVDGNGNHVAGGGNWGHCNSAPRCTTPPQQSTPVPTRLPTPLPTPRATASPTRLPTPKPTPLPTPAKTPAPTPAALGAVKWELWREMPGGSVLDLYRAGRYTLGPSPDGAYPSGPMVSFRESFGFSIEAPGPGLRSTVATSLELNCGSRLTKSFQVPKSGKYTFHITSDGPSELWVSDGRNNIADLKEFASVPTVSANADKRNSYPSPTEWTVFPTQASEPKLLTAGAWYTMRVLHKSGDKGAPHLGVAYRPVDEFSQESSGNPGRQ